MQEQWTPQRLRPYQESAIADTISAWQESDDDGSPVLRVLLVAPTGAGKTRLGEEIVAQVQAESRPVLWIAHRRELIQQAADRLRLRFGRNGVGIVSPGFPAESAGIQVATVQTLIARADRPPAELVVFDEAHHYEADLWAQLSAHYIGVRQLGLTATPQRSDGRPLGDMFQRMVVAAQYSELIRDGFLVQCRVYQPAEILGSDLAQDPIVAYQRHAEESQAFLFCTRVPQAYELADRFRAAGISAATVEAKTPKAERDSILAAFAAGNTRVLTNVFALTEGVDVPAARTVILARGVGHVGAYLQMVGRVLRPAPGKADAICIDLTGATLIHGMPTEDRGYSLEGDAIKRTSLAPLKVCPECGATILAAYRVCPECTYGFPTDPRRDPTIYDLELRAVFAGSATPDDAKIREYKRLRNLAKVRGWGIGFVVREYIKLFKERPRMDDVSNEEKHAEFLQLKAFGQSKGYKPGFAAVRYKETFGNWPPWRSA